MKRLALFFAVLFVSSWANAQDWYLTATVSQDHNIGEFKTLKDAYTEYPGGNIAIGDNFSRIVGARLSLGFNPMSGRTSVPQGRNIFERYHFYAATGFVDVTFNMIELFSHPSANRRSAVYILGGAGAMKTMMFEAKLNNHLWNDNYPAVDSKGGFYWAAHAGLAANIKLNRSLDFVIEGKYNFVPDEYNGQKFGTLDNYLELNLGLTWHFAQKERKVRTRRIVEPTDDLESIWSLEPSANSYASSKPAKQKAVKPRKEPKAKKNAEPEIYDIPEPEEGAIVKLRTPVEPKAPKVKKEKAPKVEKVKEPKPEKVKEPKPEIVKEPKAPKVEKIKEPKPEKVKEPKQEKVKEPKAPKTEKEKKAKADKSDKQAKEVFSPGNRMQTAVYFMYNFTNVDINQHTNLETIAKFLNDNPGTRLILHAYADRDNGSTEANQKLAQARAEAVILKLQRLYNIPVDRISTSIHATSLQGGVRGEDWIRAVEFEMAN